VVWGAWFSAVCSGRAGGGVEREVSGSSSNDIHLSVILVIGVRRVFKRASWTLQIERDWSLCASVLNWSCSLIIVGV